MVFRFLYEFIGREDDRCAACGHGGACRSHPESSKGLGAMGLEEFAYQHLDDIAVKTGRCQTQKRC